MFGLSQKDLGEPCVVLSGENYGYKEQVPIHILFLSDHTTIEITKEADREGLLLSTITIPAGHIVDTVVVGGKLCSEDREYSHE